MIGLHNILLIAPPSSYQTPPPPFNNIDHFNTTLNNTNYCHYHDDSRTDHGNSSKTCRECGNKAKKECEFKRCRTCCKTRGYNCSTHVKSTWVPASRRRCKQAGLGGGGSSPGSSSGGVKRSRPENMTTLSQDNAAASTFSLDNASSFQDASFKQSLPDQVCAKAVFRCRSVTTVKEGDSEIAYQAMVKISGHVFKGFLYDRGIDEKNLFPKLQSSNGKGADATSPVVDLLNSDRTTGA